MLRRAVQEVLGRGLSDPRVRGIVSVTKVTPTPDLDEALVSVTVLPGEHASLTVRGLRHAAPHIRAAVGPLVSLRRVPRLEFRLDAGPEDDADAPRSTPHAPREERPS